MAYRPCVVDILLLLVLFLLMSPIVVAVFVVDGAVADVFYSHMQEDHASMGGMAVIKMLKVVDNIETILGIELMCACQVCEYVSDGYVVWVSGGLWLWLIMLFL